MNAQASPSITPEHMLKQCSSSATQQTQRNATNATSCSPTRTPRVHDAPTPVDNEVQVTEIDLTHTRVVLAQLQGEQERLSADLEATGLKGFADRADWLIAHRAPEEQVAWRRRWRRLGVSDPEPRRERIPRPASLAAPKRRRKASPVIPVDRQLEIAMNALAKQEAA